MGLPNSLRSAIIRPQFHNFELWSSFITTNNCMELRWSIMFPQNYGGFAFNSPWAHLTKAYDVTIQRYRNSHAKIEDSKCIFCGVWVQNVVWNFKGALWNFTQNFEPIHRKICILRGAKILTTYDILRLSETGPISHNWPSVTHYDRITVYLKLNENGLYNTVCAFIC